MILCGMQLILLGSCQLFPLKEPDFSNQRCRTQLPRDLYCRDRAPRPLPPTPSLLNPPPLLPKGRFGLPPPSPGLLREEGHPLNLARPLGFAPRPERQRQGEGAVPARTRSDAEVAIAGRGTAPPRRERAPTGALGPSPPSGPGWARTPHPASLIPHPASFSLSQENPCMCSDGLYAQSHSLDGGSSSLCGGATRAGTGTGQPAASTRSSPRIPGSSPAAPTGPRRFAQGAGAVSPGLGWKPLVEALGLAARMLASCCGLPLGEGGGRRGKESV